MPEQPGPGLGDEFVDISVHSSDTVYTGVVWDVVRDTFSLPEAGQPLVRDVLRHPGAVAVIALNERDEVLLIQQYRHPVRARDWEIPAGLLDIAHEAPHRAAARELAEEADLHGATWHVLADQLNSPGGSSEAMRIFLAQDLSVLPPVQREAEELGIVSRWVDLDEAHEAVLAGKLTNATAALAILCLHAQRARGLQDLRPVTAPWPARAHLERHGVVDPTDRQ